MNQICTKPFRHKKHESNLHEAVSLQKNTVRFSVAPRKRVEWLPLDSVESAVIICLFHAERPAYKQHDMYSG
jgi:hypothetical protein